MKTLSAYEKWYYDRRQIHELLTERAENFLRVVLLHEEAQYYYKIESRVKDLDRFVKKMRDKKYTTPEEMTDVVGLRIVGFVLSDIKTLSDIVQREFKIDWKNS